MSDTDPRLPHIEVQRQDGAVGVVINMFAENGRKTFDPAKAWMMVVRFENETDPDQRQTLVQVIPDFCPYTLGTVH